MRPRARERWLGCILALVLAPQLVAQRALHIDLSGPWRASTVDRAEFATPTFNDSQWATVSLPWTRRQPEVRWLRRTVDLPADLSNVVLTLGGVGEFYELFVDGKLRGGSIGLQRGVPALALPRQFPLTLERGAARLTIAIRLTPFDTSGSILWRLDDQGPYLLSEARNAPQDAAGDRLARQQLMRGSVPVLTTVMWLLATLTFLSWLSARQDRHLLWLTVLLSVDGMRQLMGFQQLYEGATPWDYRIVMSALLLSTGAATAEFAMAILAAYSVWTRAAVWTLTILVSFLPQGQREAFVLIHLILLLTIARHALGWRSRQQRTPLWLLAVLVLMQFTQVTRVDLRGNFYFYAGPYRWPVSVIVVLVLGLVLTFASIRKLMVDRMEKLRLAGELEAARIVQNLLLQPPAFPGYEVSAVYEPAQEVGGDFYQASVLADGSLLLIVGDVSGKGLKAAMTVSLVSGLFQGSPATQPGELLQYLNRKLCGRMQGGFITACCVRIQRDGTVQAANAGHLSPYVDGGEWALDAGLPLGLDEDATYAESEARLGPGATMLLLSDGVVESANAAGDLYGFERTAAISGKPAKDMANAAKAWGQNDDITVVTVRRSS